MGLVAPRHVGSSQTRARTRVPCISRQILNHCTTREALVLDFCLLEDFFKKFLKFICLLLAALGLCCCAWTSSTWGYCFFVVVVVCELLTEVASVVVEHGL